MHKIKFILLGSALLLSTSAVAGQTKSGLEKGFCRNDDPIGTAATVARGVDGDTVHINYDGKDYSVRFLGIDTQETHYLGKTQGKWGDAAAEEMSQLLPVGTEVRLEFGGEPCDAHGRVLAQVFRASDNLHVNAEMVKTGLAVNYCVAPTFAYCEEFSALAANAIANHLGMFSDSEVELPYDFRRRISNNEQRSYVGDLMSKEVLAPGNQDSVPVANRVFFYKKGDVKAPYHIVN
jgi:micrococcal nuclease